MARDIVLDLRIDGNLTQVQRLIERGHGRRSISRALASGTLLRVCRGWVATPEASQLAVIAVVNRGILTGSTALASLGIWDAVDRRIHIQVPRNSHGPGSTFATPIAQFAAPRFAPGGLVRHWMSPRSDRRGDGHQEYPWRAPVIDALAVVARVSPPEQLVACIDSAIHQRALSRAGLPRLAALLPARLVGEIAHADGSAESGLESLVRYRISPLVRRIETQASIPGISRSGGAGRVDLLIDGWLVIELDGDEFHDPVADRQRNAILVRLGYRVHRFGYDQVVNRWAEVEATILELLRYPPHRS